MATGHVALCRRGTVTGNIIESGEMRVRAEPELQRRLLELAEIDTELNRIAHRRRNLPEAQEVERLESERTGHKDAAVAVEISIEDLDRDISKLEGEVDAVRKREQRNQERLEAGGVPAKQLSELEHENTSLHRRRGVLEDDLLAVMEQREAVQADHERSGAGVDAVDVELVEARRLQSEAQADLDSTEQGLRTRRADLLAAGLPDDLLADYDQLRERTGAGAALLRARRCGACRMEIDRAEIERIKAADPAEVIHCEECGAILVRTNESGLGRAAAE